MLRAKQLGSVEFTQNTLFIQEEMDDNKVNGKTVMSAAGTHIVYETAINTPYITLDSQEHGWIEESQRVALMSMRSQLGTTFTLTYDDDTTETVRMAREKPMIFTPLSEGCEIYTAIIPLAKV